MLNRQADAFSHTYYAAAALSQEAALRVTPRRLSVRPSVRLSVPYPPLTQTGQHEKRLPTSRITGRPILRSKGQSSMSLRWKNGGPHTVSVIGAAISCIRHFELLSLQLEDNKLSYCWVSSRYDMISDTGRYIQRYSPSHGSQEKNKRSK